MGQERAIVSSVAGTTRDAIDTDLIAPNGGRFTLVDTAGIRRKGAVASSPDGAESLSVQRAVRAVRRCEVSYLPWYLHEVAWGVASSAVAGDRAESRLSVAQSHTVRLDRAESIEEGVKCDMQHVNARPPLSALHV